MFYSLFGYTLDVKKFRRGRLNELEKVKNLLYFVRILSAPNHVKRLLKLPKQADAPFSYS